MSGRHSDIWRILLLTHVWGSGSDTLSLISFSVWARQLNDTPGVFVTMQVIWNIKTEATVSTIKVKLYHLVLSLR